MMQASTKSIAALAARDMLSTIIPPHPSMPSRDWGRETRPKLQNTLVCLSLILSCPILIIVNWIALEQYDGSLAATLSAAYSTGPNRFLLRNLPKPSTAAAAAYTAWILFQALLYAVLPGPVCHGQLTPGGNLLTYTANGFVAWVLTHILFLTASVLGLVDPAIIARHWPGLLVAANIVGFLLAILAQAKGILLPTHREDRKFSGSWLYDFWAGIELNPRFGSTFDLKFFMNGRPGLLAWTLVDLSFAAYQYQTFGHVTASMLLVLILQSLYVVDFFCNESWYTRTIDISHDHFGFMLAWGDSTFLPAFYTLQAQYLAKYPTYLNRWQSCTILALGFFSYAMFRSANYQRDHIRTNNGDAYVWGQKATFIRCTYTTSDGKTHESLLVTSGWWGVARHANYLIDLVQTWCWCATCGFTNLLPWSYMIFLTILLCHRAGRDDRRCRIKYGDKWDEYCAAVPWRIVPGIY